MLPAIAAIASAKLARIGDQVAQRRQDAAADRSREGRQYQRGARDDEPGVDLLALDDVPLGMRVVETLLRRVFCFVVGIVGHRGALALWFENDVPGTLFLIMFYFSGVSWCITPTK
jgi:hypothetical protein